MNQIDRLHTLDLWHFRVISRSRILQNPYDELTPLEEGLETWCLIFLECTVHTNLERSELFCLKL